MPQTRIPITQMKEPIPARVFFRILSGGFFLGLLIGVLSLQSSSVANITDLIAGVGSVDVPSEESTKVPARTDDVLVSSEESAPSTDTSQVVNEIENTKIDEVPTLIPPPAPTPEQSIEDSEDRRLRLSREIAQLKNASVELIAQFNQNCGAWTDACAVPYVAQLEKNNSAYDDVARELGVLTTGQ